MDAKFQNYSHIAECLNRQREEGLGGELGINLSRLWREAGEPAGDEPAAWLGLAGYHLARGLESYFLALRGVTEQRPSFDAATWHSTLDHVEGEERPHDTYAYDPLGEFYAMYLERQSEVDVFRQIARESEDARTPYEMPPQF